jgi:predicted DNA-binding transcriptional regulator YafY
LHWGIVEWLRLKKSWEVNMSQRQQLERIFYIDASIRAGRYPTADLLAEELEVSRRVVFTDREFMVNRLWAPIEFDHERGGWWYTSSTWTLPNMMITEGELLAFFLSMEVARWFVGTGFEADLLSAVNKICKNVYDQAYTKPQNFGYNHYRNY